MNARLKVIGGNLDGSNRVIVACRSFKEFGLITGMGVYHARQRACETGNEEEIQQAMKSPGVAFIRPYSAPRGAPWRIKP